MLFGKSLRRESAQIAKHLACESFVHIDQIHIFQTELRLLQGFCSCKGRPEQEADFRVESAKSERLDVTERFVAESFGPFFGHQKNCRSAVSKRARIGRGDSTELFI